MGRVGARLAVGGAAMVVAGCGSAHTAPPVSGGPHRIPGKQRTFATPVPKSGACAMAAGIPGLPTEVECWVFPAAKAKVGSVTLYTSGRVRVCHGQGCLANPEARRPLRLGQSAVVGPFRCASLRVGIRCVVTKTERGFLLSAGRVKRI